MITLLLSLFLLAFISGVFIVPLNIVVNSRTNKYYIQLPGYLRVDLLFSDEYKFDFSFKIFFFKVKIKRGERKKKRKSQSSNSRQIPKRKARIKNPIELGRKTLHQIKIIKCNVNMDTGNFPLNAQLIPIIQTISNDKIILNINFQNINYIDIHLKTRLIKMMYVLLKHKILHK